MKVKTASLRNTYKQTAHTNTVYICEHQAAYHIGMKSWTVKFSFYQNYMLD